MKRIYWVILSLMILSTACAQAVDVQSVVSTEPYGFWSGCWHGIIAPISFFISLFDHEVAMYAVNNNGGWYDFGFVLGAGILFGGGGKGSSRKRD